MMVQGKEDDGHIILKLGDGEDLMQCLDRAISEFNIGSGLVIMGIGMLRDAEIGFFTGTGYEKKTCETPHELVTLHGSISTEGERVIHLHCALAGPDHKIVGGHLFSAKVCVVNEILIKKVEAVLARELNPRTGLKELVIR